MIRSLPTFVGIGAQRSGTTWLSEVLRTHPDIGIGRKELHFFDKQDSRGGTGVIPVAARRLWPWDRSRYHLKFAALRSYRAVGEFTPAYAALPEASIETISRWLPDVKLIFLMRDPVERSWSQARMYFHDRTGDSRSVPIEHLERFAFSPFVHCRSDYATSIRRWLTYFPHEQFWFGLTTDITTRPRALCSDLFAFLGVDPTHDPGVILEEVRNERPLLEMPPALRRRLEKRYASQSEEIRALTGLDVEWGPAEEVGAEDDG